MNSISLIDYIKYNVLKVRTPELIEKINISNLIDKLKKNKYQFVDFKINGLSSDCAAYIYDIYRLLSPLIGYLKEDFKLRDGKEFANYIIEDSLNQTETELRTNFTIENIQEELKKNNNSAIVFKGAKSSFLKFKDSFKSEKVKNYNLMFSAFNDFVQIIDFDFYLFLKSFMPSMVEGINEKDPVFRSVRSIQAVDDLIKLDCAVQSISIRKELITTMEKYCKFRDITSLPEKKIKLLLSKIRYLQTSNILTDTIILLLKDFSYKPTISISESNIFLQYMTDITQTFKDDIDSISISIKNEKITSVKNKIFANIEISKLINFNEEFNELLEKSDCLTFSFIDALQYIKTFKLAIFDKLYKAPLNELLLALEFKDKNRSAQAFDAFYYISGSYDNISKLDEKLESSTENGKKLRGWLSSKNKAAANRDFIESLVGKFNEEGMSIVMDVYNSIIDLMTIIKNIEEDASAGSQNEILNAGKIKTLHLYNIELGQKLQEDFDILILLLKNFIR